MIGVIIFLSVVYIGHTLNLTDKDIKFEDIKTKQYEQEETKRQKPRNLRNSEY